MLASSSEAVAPIALPDVDTSSQQRGGSYRKHAETVPRTDPRLQALLSRARSLVALELGSWGLANMAWSVAVLCLPDHPLLDAIASASLVKMSEFKPEQLVSTAWAVSASGFLHPPLMSAIA